MPEQNSATLPERAHAAIAAYRASIEAQNVRQRERNRRALREQFLGLLAEWLGIKGIPLDDQDRAHADGLVISLCANGRHTFDLLEPCVTGCGVLWPVGSFSDLGSLGELLERRAVSTEPVLCWACHEDYEQSRASAAVPERPREPGFAEQLESLVRRIVQEEVSRA